MGFSLNKQQLIGRLGRDAEVSFTTNNKQIVKFSLATDHRVKNKSGEYENKSTWHNVVIIAPIGDYIKDRLKKGAKFFVEGRTEHTEYEKDGERRHYTSVVVLDFNAVIPLDNDSAGHSRSSSSSSDDSGDDLPF